MKKIIAIILSLSIGAGAVVYATSHREKDVDDNDTTLVNHVDEAEETTTSASVEMTTLADEETTTSASGEVDALVDEKTTKQNTESPTQSTEQTTKQSKAETTTKNNKLTPTVKPGKTNVGKNNVTSSTTEVEMTEDYLKYYDKWEKPLEVYEHDNVVVHKNLDKYAYISVYTTKRGKAKETEIKKEFKKAFGFEPTGTVECNYEGIYVVDGYNEPQQIYHYCIYDCTYPLLEDELCVVTKKICVDGSPWVGFAIKANEIDSIRCSELRRKMGEVFYEWTGYDSDYMRNNDNFAVGNIIWSTARTENNELIEIAYIFTRAYGITTDINGKPITL